MLIARSKQEISNFISTSKSQGKVAFVPTMGALHKGHLSLVELAKKHADIVVASIFVNPTQFGPNEDFTKYPRDEERDIKMLKSAGCNAAFLPNVEEIYPSETSITIQVKEKADILCGKFRPGHFDGVALVVSKLFNIIKPDVAVFGEKDFQQLYIIKNVTRDLNFSVDIVGAPIMREADGLAMSSRNLYLTDRERKIAAHLNLGLKQAAQNIFLGESVEKTLNDTKKYLLDSGFDKIDYIEARSEASLEPMEKKLNQAARIFAAAYVGKTRLIDNWNI